jgi:Ca-activated chloride channel homolog
MMLVIVALLPLQITLITPKWWWIVTWANMVILFDVSLSMVTTDLKPNRFAAAKEMVSRLIEASPWSALAITVYSGIPITLAPMSFDLELLNNQWQNFGLWVLPPTWTFVWTALWDALIYGANIIARQQEATWYKRPDIILLITDGDNNIGTNPYDTITGMKQMGVPVYTVQIGANQEILWYDKAGSPIRATIDPMVLSIISQETGAKSYILGTQQELDYFVTEMTNILWNYETIRELPRVIRIHTILLWILACITAALVVYTIKKIIHLSQRHKRMTSYSFMKS